MMRNAARNLALGGALLALGGCGGGIGGDLHPATPPPGRSGSPATALFHVDVASGSVSVQPVSDTGGRASAPASRAVFTGTAIAFSSSMLLDQPGDAGRKVLDASLTNRSGETIGLLANGTLPGLKVIFGDFTNVAPLAELRRGTTVSTAAGSGAAAYADGSVASASFSQPCGVAADSAGALYVADTGNHRVRKVANGYLSTLAGSGTAGYADGLGTAARFNRPVGIAVNPVDGAVIVGDSAGNRIRRVDSSGTVSTVAGTGAAGGDNGTGDLATFNAPQGLSVDAGGTIYVVESSGNRVRRISLTGGDRSKPNSYSVTTLAGSGTSGYADGTGAGASFSSPCGVAVDSAGFLYVADSGNRRIRRVTASGDVTTVAGTGIAAESDGMGDTACFNQPEGIVWTGGCLVVSDAVGGTLRQVRLLPGAAPTSPCSWAVQTLAGTYGLPGSTDGEGSMAAFAGPRQLCVSPTREVYVADSPNHKVRRLTPNGGVFPLGTVGGDVPPSEPVQLSNPDGLMAGTRRPYVLYGGPLTHGATSETKRWSFIVPEGVMAFDFTVTVDANPTSLAAPSAVSNVDSSGSGSPDVMVRTLAGVPGVRGYVNGPGSLALFRALGGVARDALGALYVADYSGNAIRRISATGVVTTVAGMEGAGPGSANGTGVAARFANPMGIAVTTGPNSSVVVYVADVGNNQIRRIALALYGDPADPARWTVTTIAGSPAGTAGSGNGRGDVATFSSPIGLAVDGAVLYVTEWDGNRVRRVSYQGGDASLAANWRVALVAGDVGAVNGQPGAANGTGAAARFANPDGIAMDAGGNLYVADYGNNRVRKIAPGGVVTTLAGSTAGYADGAGSAAHLTGPVGVAVDPAGYLYVTDSGNRRVRRVSATGVVATVAGTGDSGSADGPGSAATFTGLSGICVDPYGTLYVTDEGAFTVRSIQRILRTGSP